MQTNSLPLLCFVLLAGLLTGCSQDEVITPRSKEFTFDFATGPEDWQGGFADYPVGEEEFYALSAGYSALPERTDTTDGAIRQSGNNHSDDLFMFVKKKLTGLTPNRTYAATFEIRLLTNAADGSFGIGGSPGSSVYVKAGLTRAEPLPVADTSGFYLMNLDKGNQQQDGPDMMTIGDLANGTEETVYVPKNLTNATPFEFRADANGEAWAIIGTDSGYEGTTTLYYDRIVIRLK